MPNVKVLRPHTVKGVVRDRGETYEENERLAKDKALKGLVELVDVRAKVDYDMYAPRSYDVVVEDAPQEEPEAEELRVIGRSGNWYMFSDGEKVLGRSKAAEKLGVSVEELADVDFDDE